MRLLHFADLHIGVENYSRTDPNTGLSSRLTDFLSAFDELVDFAIETRIDAVLFAGDAYKNRDPSQTHQREFAKRIAKLASTGIPVFLTVGNHDLPAIPGRATALEIYPTLNIPGVYVADTIATTTLHTPSGVLQVVGLPWVRRGSFLASHKTRDMSLDGINTLLRTRLTESLAEEFKKLDPNIPAVLVGHVTVEGATLGSERSMMLGRDHYLFPSAVTNPLLDYVALGHIHKHQIVSQSPSIVYSGSLQRVDFSEEAEEKGFCIIELDPTSPPGKRFVSCEFKPVHARTFLTIEVTIPQDDPDPTQRVINSIASKHIVGAIIRLRIQVPEELESMLQEGAIRDALSEAHYVAGIQRDVLRSHRTRLPSEATKDLSPKEALRLYLGSRSTDIQQTNRLLQSADLLLREELEGVSEHGEAPQPHQT